MTRRTERLEDQIRSDLSAMLQREVVDPRLANGAIISITDVELSTDLRNARVFVSIMGSPEQTREAFAAIRHAAGYLRRSLAQLLSIRHTPELTFELDKSLQHGARVFELLKELEKEGQAQPKQGEQAGKE